MPGEVGPGVAIRAVPPMDDGRCLAQRVYAIPESAAEREQAYAWSRDRVVTLDPTTIDCSVVTVMAREAAPPAPVVTRRRPRLPPPPALTPAPNEDRRSLLESNKIELRGRVPRHGQGDAACPRASASLNEAGAALGSYPELKVEVGGHTGLARRGKCQDEPAAEQARAESPCAPTCFEHFKIAPGSLTARGYGEPANGVIEKSDAERQHNRRVELNVIK